ncbi:hypothetical protein NA56DRAFT_96473 [Hyaloscypha hepaticicola]|uniref:Uncharacterized protein n=1 Tax=Hyaloscypha hepaticicola TaxID=2082293 RepID=A0A2J6Q7D6_9HELO|nr:hypothetical protein NA56DRAFT_96473 [Hyaloscypha hepaticicola]
MPELSRAKRKLKDSGALETGGDDPTKRPKGIVDVDRDDLYPTKLPRLQQSPTSRTKRSLRARTQLCQRCAKLDIDTLLSRQHKTYRGLPVATLGPGCKMEDWMVPILQPAVFNALPRMVELVRKATASVALLKQDIVHVVEINQNQFIRA